MRTLLAGLVCLVIAIALTEYQRREPVEKDGSVDAVKDPKQPAKPKLPKAVAALLETDEPGEETLSADTSLAALLKVPAGEGPFVPVAGGAFQARELKGAFGAVLFLIDGAGVSGVVRAAVGEAPSLLFSRPQLDALAVDGSAVFVAQGGLIIQTHARALNEVKVRARFKNAVVTSLAVSGDSLVATLMPEGVDPLSTDAVGAVVALNSDDEVALVAQEVTRPRAAQTDGKDAYWVAGYPGAVWRGALDGAFSSQLTEPADAPLMLDGDVLYFRAPLGSGTELRRIGRAGGKLATLAVGDVLALTVSSGLARYAVGGEAPKLFEVTQGADATELSSLDGSVRGVALGGTSLFVLTQQDGEALLRAK